jgi:hypothetical protein
MRERFGERKGQHQKNIDDKEKDLTEPLRD